jgi:gliding motility-associated-like protein
MALPMTTWGLGPNKAATHAPGSKPAGPTDASFTVTNDHCLQGIGSIEVTSVTGGQAPYTYSVDSISFVPGIIANLEAGNYRLYIKDANNEVLVKYPVAVLNITGPDSVSLQINQPTCDGLTGDIYGVTVSGGFPPFQYSLNGIDYHPDGNFNDVLLGTYQFTVKDAFGCLVKKTITIARPQFSGIALFPRDTTVCENETVVLRIQQTGGPLTGIAWSIASPGTTATLNVAQTQKVWVSARDANNCPISDTAIVRAKPCYPTQNCFALPNAFTPNGDGKNDLFKPALNGCLFKALRFRVFDRWGTVLFDTQRPGAGWDGTHKGLQQGSGAYIFTCSYTVEGGGSHFLKGTVMLVR